MSLQIVTASEKTHDDWTRYVEGHADATPYHSIAWVNSVEKGYGHENASYLAYENGVVVGVLPLINMPVPFGKSRFVSLPFCDMGYPLGDSREVVDQLLLHASQLAEQSHASVCEVRDYLRASSAHSTDTSNSAEAVNSTIVTTGTTGTTDISASASQTAHHQKVSMLLSLPDDKETLFSSFKSKLRSQVRKAEKNGLTSELGNTASLIDEFYEVFAQNMHKLGSPVHSKGWFQALAEEYGDNLTVGVVRSEGQCIGAGIVLSLGHKIAIPWASTLSDFNRLSPNMMLYWNFLAMACDTGKTQFDFGRSTFGEGTYKFKQQWGAEPRPLAWYDLLSESVSASHDKEENSEPSKLRSIVESVWTRLPLSLTKTLGPMVRKHISL